MHMKIGFYGSSAVGLLLLAGIVSFLSFDISKIWIPLSAILVLMSLQTLMTKRNLSVMEARLKQLETQIAGKVEA